MKQFLTLIILLSLVSLPIFSGAQNLSGTYYLCGFQGKTPQNGKAANDPQSIFKNYIPKADLLNKLKDSCGKVFFTNTTGSVYKITTFTFIITTKKTGNAYFEKVVGDQITYSIMKKLEKSGDGDLILIAEIQCIKPNGTEGTLGGIGFVINEK